jgi:HEAT repeat protein
VPYDAAPAALGDAVRAARVWDAMGTAPGSGECPDCALVYAAVEAALCSDELDRVAVEQLLWLVSWDEEPEFILGCLVEHPKQGLRLATMGIAHADEHARWQLAVFLGTQPDPGAVALLRRYIEDPDEYVRRRALLAAVSHDAAFAEARAWSRLTDPHEYSRADAIWVLWEVKSALLPEALQLLRGDPSAVVEQRILEVTRAQTQRARSGR